MMERCNVESLNMLVGAALFTLLFVVVAKEVKESSTILLTSAKCGNNVIAKSATTNQTSSLKTHENKTKQKKDLKDPRVIKSLKKRHRRWCDKENKGITHFGVHPSKLNIESIVFDVFHLCSAVVRKLLHWFCGLLNKHDHDDLQSTSTFLSQFGNHPTTQVSFKPISH